MEKSIESIWKNGFINNENIVIPKLNNLYNQRSLHIIEKFRRIGKINLIGIGIFSFGVLIAALLTGVYVVGIAIASILAYIVYVGVKQSEELDKIEMGDNSYEYLKSFDAWIKKSFAKYISIYRFIYPALVILFALWTRMSSWGELFCTKVAAKYPDIPFVWDTPLPAILFVAFAAIVFSVFSKKLFMLDLKPIYGGILDKLENLLKEMEELRMS